MSRLLSILIPVTAVFGFTSAAADVVVAVSSKSALTVLAKQQISDLFLGKAASFPDGTPAVPLEQTEGSAAREEFHGKVTGKSGAQLRAYWSKQVFSGKGSPPKEVTGADMKRLLADNPSTIGYIDKAALDASLRAVFAP